MNVAKSFTGRTLFRGLPNPFQAGRYHSLQAEAATLPDVLEVTARSETGEIMGVRHRTLPLEGVQFHPESVLTPLGYRILANLAGRCGHAVDDAERVAG